KYRRVFISPETATDPAFREAVLSKDSFYKHLRAVVIDESHCISHWGSAFRDEYSMLGLLRGRLPTNVPLLVASATLPPHVMNDISEKLGLSSDCKLIRMSNARYNVGLQVRQITGKESTKAALRFTIPHDAQKAEDIPVQLIYCNTVNETQDICEALRAWLLEQNIRPDCVAFYNAKVGSTTKRKLEERLRNGDLRILVCTDAVGMGCDMRNIERVVIWKLPPSFCALVQRCGRAARDFSRYGTAVLMVPASTFSSTIPAEVSSTSVAQTTSTPRDPTPSGPDENATQAADVSEPIQAEDNEDLGSFGVLEEGVVLAAGRELVLVPEGGLRVETAVNDQEIDENSSENRTTKKMDPFGELESRYLTEYVSTTSCRWNVWNRFFENDKKGVNPPPSMCKRLPDKPCCDNCEPDEFIVDRTTVIGASGLKRGKKRKFPESLVNSIREALRKWRHDYFFSLDMYKGLTSISSTTLMSNDVIDQIATCGDRL
ncbi:P-loop containing nucleoside triphosphate hydrolase protein, partial [Rickenella mellea]